MFWAKPCERRFEKAGLKLELVVAAAQDTVVVVAAAQDTVVVVAAVVVVVEPPKDKYLNTEVVAVSAVLVAPVETEPPQDVYPCSREHFEPDCAQ